MRLQISGLLEDNHDKNPKKEQSAKHAEQYLYPKKIDVRTQKIESPKTPKARYDRKNV
jgi:hypothetical protein